MRIARTSLRHSLAKPEPVEERQPSTGIMWLNMKLQQCCDKHTAVEAEHDTLVNGEQPDSGASSTSTQHGRAGAPAAAQEAASTHVDMLRRQDRQAPHHHHKQTGKRTTHQAAADVPLPLGPESCKMSKQLPGPPPSSLEASSAAQGVSDTDDANPAATTQLQPMDTEDSNAEPSSMSTGLGKRPPSALDDPPSPDAKKRSFLNQPSQQASQLDPDSDSSDSQASQQLQVGGPCKIQPARPKPMSASMANCNKLPLGIQELAALGQQQDRNHSQHWAMCSGSRQPSPTASSCLTLSASSAFTAVPRKQASGDWMMQQRDLCAPSAARLHCAMAAPPSLHITGHASVGRFSGAAAAAACLVPTGNASARQLALSRYLLKRKNRSFKKKVLYESRKRLADARPRVRGQFVKAVVAVHPAAGEGTGPIGGCGSEASGEGAGGAATAWPRAAHSACSTRGTSMQ